MLFSKNVQNAFGQILLGLPEVETINRSIQVVFIHFVCGTIDCHVGGNCPIEETSRQPMMLCDGKPVPYGLARTGIAMRVFYKITKNGAFKLRRTAIETLKTRSIADQTLEARSEVIFNARYSSEDRVRPEAL
jgi:hypothetical protein